MRDRSRRSTWRQSRFRSESCSCGLDGEGFGSEDASVSAPAKTAPGVVFLCLHKSWQAGGISRTDDAGKEGMPSADRDCTVARLNVIFALVRYDAFSQRIQLRLSIKINQLLTYTHTCGPTGTRVMRVISPVSFVRVYHDESLRLAPSCQGAPLHASDPHLYPSPGIGFRI